MRGGSSTEEGCRPQSDRPVLLLLLRERDEVGDPRPSRGCCRRSRRRFRDRARRAGLYWAAYETPGTPEKIAIYERLKTEFPPEKFSWSESGMSDLFDVLAATDRTRRALAATC
jgi:hypothetical protein